MVREDLLLSDSEREALYSRALALLELCLFYAERKAQALLLFFCVEKITSAGARDHLALINLKFLKKIMNFL